MDDFDIDLISDFDLGSISDLDTDDKYYTFNDFKQIDSTSYDKLLNYYDKLIKKSYKYKLCETRPYSNNSNIIFPRFWQEFYYLFYISLYMIKNYYSSNSNIICIGQSPSNFIFSQSLFYEDNDVLKMLTENSYPINLNFLYFPISKLNQYTFDGSIRINITHNIVNEQYLYKILENKINDKLIENYLHYFKKFNLDPLTIINSSKEKFIFVDRTENFRSCVAFLYIYRKMIEKQNCTQEQIQIFIQKFKFIGFDGSYDDPRISELYKTKMINFLNYLYSTENGNNMFDFFIINNKNLEITNKLGNNLLILKNNFNITDSFINLSSVPEHLYVNIRCIKKIVINIDDSIDDVTEPNIKEDKGIKQDYDESSSNNCNLINFIIFYTFKTIKTKNLLELILNLDKINVDKLRILNYDYINIEELKKIDKEFYTDINFNRLNCENEREDFKKFFNLMFTKDNTIFQENYFVIPLIPEEMTAGSKYKLKYIKYKYKYLLLKKK